ncbi:MAG: protein-L-isoaspartate(D-aspartate) O-methyltransferase [Spirochaetales bacterium]|nr:protein-L-isoaspartate(D-aspartate) O-methyltransferase [Spirochaetales bacterium]
MEKRFFIVFIPLFLFVYPIYSRGSAETFPDDNKDPAQEMVSSQIEARGVTDLRVLSAMLKVSREDFVPEEYRSFSYADRPLPIGFGQTISQPYIVALMTELLELEEGEKVLEIGTGSGYQAAVLSRLTDEVFTIEIIGELSAAAGKRFSELGYHNIRWKTGDGYYGWAGETFDGIIVTAAAGHVPPPLIRQLKVGGRMVIPIGGRFQPQVLTLIIKDENHTVTAVPVLPVAFVPFTGEPMETGE